MSAASDQDRNARGAPSPGRAAVVAVAALAGVLIGLMVRPAPGLAAAQAREALAEARRQDVHRTTPVAYRRAELAYLDAGQEVARANDSWFPRYARAGALYERSIRLVAEAVAGAAVRDPGEEHRAVQSLADLLEIELEEAGAQLEELGHRWTRAGRRPDLAGAYRQSTRALEARLDTIRERLSEGDRAEAAALAVAARSQLRVLQHDLVAWRLSMEIAGE